MSIASRVAGIDSVIEDAIRIMDAANVGVASFRSKIDDDVKAYGAHMEELSWLVTNHGGSMTPEQVDAAIADYKKEKGPEWEAKAETLRKRSGLRRATVSAPWPPIEWPMMPWRFPSTGNSPTTSAGSSFVT